jgi:N,N'-diacetyllegionaminate synthase
MTSASITVAGRAIGPTAPCFIIAEAGVNHDGWLDRAHRLVSAAADAGADAVKFQMFSANRLATAEAPQAAYQEARVGRESQRDMLRRLELGAEAHRELAAASRARGLLFLSTPFDEQSADCLHDIGVPAFKIPSGEITNFPLLTHIARFGKPVLLSTGMSTLGDVDRAVTTLRENGCVEIVLLQCTSCYPADPRDANLHAMETLARVFDVPVGFSDHTLGHEAALAAVALGAAVVEKHLTLDRAATGPDHAASLEPPAFASLVRSIRTVEQALGDPLKRPVAGEREVAAAARRSLVASRDIAAGSRITSGDLVLRRPGTGLSWDASVTILGRVARIDIAVGSLIAPEMFR